MRFGIIGAMESEVEILKKTFDCTEENYKNLTFYLGNAGKNEAVIVKSGIGKVCAAAAAVLLIERYKCDAVINTGVAGGIYDDCIAGDEVIASHVAHHDFDLRTFGYELGQVPGRPVLYPCDEKLVAEAKKYVSGRVIVGTVLSGEMFVASDEKVKFLKEHFENAKAVEMEGAAVGQVCYDFGIPFLVLRAISDGANDGAALSFEEFELLAAKRSSELLIKLISAYQ